MLSPETTLIVSVLATVFISAICSLTEAALYAVPISHIQAIASKGSISGQALLKLKSKISKPIAAILILNTISNTGGAAIAGWAAGKIFSEFGLAVFSICFVLAILYLSEITPKVIGVAYSKTLAPRLAIPLMLLVKLLSPLIFITQGISSKFEKRSTTVSLSEVLAMAKIGLKEGVLDDLEGSVIKNIIGLDKVLVKDILTPRVVVFRAPEDKTLKEIKKDLLNWAFSRVPVYNEDNPDILTGYVLQRDIFRELLRGNEDISLAQIKRPITVVPEVMSSDKLLQKMFESKEQICAVVDEHGSLAGIVTLEDIIEEIVGKEIVDEYDTVTDLRTLAKVLKLKRKR